MRTQITSVAIAMALVAFPELGEARKQLVGMDEKRLEERSSPVVGTATCEDRCVFGKDLEDKEYWCFQFKEPVIKAGWEYKQTANTDKEATPMRYFRWDLIYYLQLIIQVTSQFDIYRLYFNKTIVEVPQQDWKLNIGFIINQKAQYCPHLSYDRSAIKFKITYR